MKFLLLLLVVSVIGLAYGVYHFATKNPFDPKIAVPSAPAQRDIPQRQQSTGPVIGDSRATPAPLWTVIQEGYRGGDGETYLHTDVGQYEVNVMSDHGFVEAVQGTRAKLRLPNGGIGYLITKYKPVNPEQVSTMESVPPTADMKAETYFPPKDDEWKRLNRIAERRAGVPDGEFDKASQPMPTPTPKPTPKPIRFRTGQSVVSTLQPGQK